MRFQKLGFGYWILFDYWCLVIGYGLEKTKYEKT